MNDDNTTIVFTSEDGRRMGFVADYDCCSESWFSHLSGLDNLLGNTVEDVIMQEERESDGTRQERDVVYGVRIISKNRKGIRLITDLEMRNSSNGYYGGSISPVRVTDDVRLTTIGKDFDD